MCNIAQFLGNSWTSCLTFDNRVSRSSCFKVSTDPQIMELIWSGKVGEFCWCRGKWRVSSELRDCCLLLFKKWKCSFCPCYNKVVMESSRSRWGWAEWELHKTSTCTWDGTGNNAEQLGKVREFDFWNWMETLCSLQQGSGLG